MVATLLPPPESTTQKDGYLCFDVAYRDEAWFRAAVFGHPNPSTVLLMRLTDPAVPAPNLVH
jgi:hypothetical protein